MEPGAATCRDKINALQELHDASCKTWGKYGTISYSNIHEQDLSELLEAISFTDKIIFGRTNYSKETTAYKKQQK